MTARLDIIIDAKNRSTTGMRQASGDLDDLREQSRRAAREFDRFSEAEERARKESGSLTGSLDGVKGALGGLGLAVGAAELISFGKGAIDSANNLEKTKAVVEELSGSEARYAQVLDLARKGQDLYGGSLKEQLDGLRGLIPLSKNAGVALADLDLVSRKLALASPEQGLEGAAVALKEFATGDGADAVLSLAERFELPRKALQDIIATSPDAESRVRALSQLLAEQGITNEALTASTNTTAASYDRLGAAASNAKDRIGAFLAEAFQPAAEGATKLLTGFDGTQEGFFRLAEGADFFSKSLFGLQSQSMQLGETEKQMVGTLLSWIGIESEATIAAQQHTAALTGDADASIGLSNALQQATIKLQEQQAALQEDATKALLADANSQLLAQTKAQLAAQAESAAQSLINAGAAGAQEAARLAASSNLVDQLTAAHYRLAAAAQASAAAQALQRASNDRIAQENATRNGRTVSQALGATASEAQAAAARALARQQAVDRAKLAEQEGRRAATAQSKRESAAKRENATAVRDAERLAKARDNLRSDEEKLAARRAELAKNPPEQRRLELLAEIKQLEQDISEERTKQAEAAIDAQLASIDDRKKRREEERELTRARRVLESSATSDDQKAAARDVLERIPLEQQKRALDLAEKQRDAGTAVPASGAEIPARTLPPGSSPARPGTTNFLPLQPSQLNPTLAQQIIQNTLNVSLGVRVFVGAEEVAAAVESHIHDNTAQNLRIAIERLGAGGG